MRTFTYHRVVLEAVSYTLPDEIVSSAEIESRLGPLYKRLKLPEGRLELMTGIRERRFFPQHALVSPVSVQTVERLLAESGVDRGEIGTLIHGSVCRDFMEPATACGVHHALGLPDDCVVYDLSNACLGQLTGAMQIANQIELGQIRAGIVVGTESAKDLVETTIRCLNADPTLTRKSVKDAIASLTIGSASTAMLLVDESISRGGHRLLGGVVHSNTRGSQLCQGDRSPVSHPMEEKRTERGSESVMDTGTSAMGVLMKTDSTALLEAGVATAVAAFESFLTTVGWQRESIHRTCCHQVGRVHTRRLFESLGLDPSIDSSTFEYLGNTGSAALPVTLAISSQRGRIQRGDQTALLGIGSGINTMMFGLEW